MRPLKTYCVRSMSGTKPGKCGSFSLSVIRILNVPSEQFGLSNFFSWEVRILIFSLCILLIISGCRICQYSEGKWLDTAHGLSGALQCHRKNCGNRVGKITTAFKIRRLRAITFRLLPCLRKYGLKFYAYSPLACVPSWQQIWYF